MVPQDSPSPHESLERQGFTIDEVAASTPCSRRFIEMQIALGHLRAHKVGRKTLILRESWESWLRSRPIEGPRHGP